MRFLALLSYYWQLHFGATTVLFHLRKQKAFLGKWHYTALVTDNMIFFSGFKSGGFGATNILCNENNFLLPLRKWFDIF